jgi:hypothetical protein
MSAKALFVDALYCSRLVVEAVGLLPQAIVKRQRAKSTFKKTLITEGVPAEIANELAREFPNPMTTFINIVKSST